MLTAIFRYVVNVHLQMLLDIVAMIIAIATPSRYCAQTERTASAVVYQGESAPRSAERSSTHRAWSALPPSSEGAFADREKFPSLPTRV